ncbi:spermatid-associated protein [Numida meleagris]|uniref:spermatid-associated protein n=1 Tax=Numida meleagris TaxID=8996 RepID=UPI000B3DB29F|nr:spermatid-associated protein [Numida meleagris]
MSAFDLTNQSTQCTKPEMDYVFPQMKLRDETFTFIDGKWVNEMHCQPTFAPQRRLFSKKTENEWTIWEENRALWEENQVLRIENRMLWEENKALQYLQSQNKGVQLVYSDTIQQSLQKDHKLSPFFPERYLGFQVSPGNKALQLIGERNRVLKFFHQQNRTVPTIWKDQQAIVERDENKGDSPVQKATKYSTAAGEGSLGPSSQQEHDAKEESTTPTENDTKTAPSTQDDNEILQALHDLYHILQVFLKEKCLPDDRESLHTLQDDRKFFQEEYKKLKLHLNNVKNTVSDITTQMEMLEKELITITFPIYEEAGKNMASECQLGEM